MTSRTDLPPATHPGRVALRVNDLDRQVDFYADVVGLNVARRTDDRAVLKAGDEDLLILIADPNAPARQSEEAGLFHVAFRVPTRAALADALRRIDKQWRLDGASDHHVSEALYLSDPEGNGVEIYHDRPREEWPTAGGRVQMDTLPLDLDELSPLASGDDDVPPGTDVGHIHLEATSLPAAREFYVDALGLQVRQEFGPAALFVAAGDYHHHVGLNVWNNRTAPKSADSCGLKWFELLIPDQEQLDAARDRLSDYGVTITALENGYAVSDPDGITLRLRVDHQ